jgi:hypothetical protein
MTRRKSGEAVSWAMVLRPRLMGTPALTKVASCRVKRMMSAFEIWYRDGK